jgi:integrase
VVFSRFFAFSFSAFSGLLNTLFLYRIKTYEVIWASRAIPILSDTPHEAVKNKLIAVNPCAEVKELKATEPERDILTVEEVRRLFPADWSTVWESKVIYQAHRLAACTGLRVAELRGLRGEYVFDDYIYITGQYTRYGYKGHTKTKQNRNIPITSLMREELEELIRANGEGFVFSDDGGATPVTVERINRQIERALGRIGIDHAEKMKRNISFHGWLLKCRDSGFLTSTRCCGCPMWRTARCGRLRGIARRG